MAVDDAGRVVHVIEPVSVILDRDRLLVCDFEALLQIEKAFGIEALDTKALDSVIFSKKAETFLTLLWILLRKDDPELTLEYTAKIIGYLAYGEVQTAVLRSFIGALPEPKPAEGVADAEGEDSPGSATGE